MAPALALKEMAAAAHEEPEALLRRILEQLTSDQRTEFLDGLSERVLNAAEPGGAEEVQRWIGSWFVSLRLIDDAAWCAADDEATKLLTAGKLGEGLTSRQLRARYGR